MDAKEPRRFSIGICATGHVDLGRLLECILSESLPKGFHMSEVVVVASACPPDVLTSAHGIAAIDKRIVIIEDEVRRGKTDAINQIIRRFRGDFLILLNSDAKPEPGSIAQLLMSVGSDEGIGSVSAHPVFEPGIGVTSRLLQLMWVAHNTSSLELNDLNVSNHSSDELIAIRSEVLRKLPDGLVNDGAYLGGIARANGYSVRFCTSARVRIDVPRRPIDIIRQRRRIIFGHNQVWRMIGSPPKTIESLLFISPRTGVKLIGDLLCAHPEFMLILPVAAVTEALSGLLAIWDSSISTDRHTVWKRFGV